MVFVTIAFNTVSPEAAHELCRTFFHRYDLRVRPGWIRGACAIHTENPLRVLIFQEWGSRATWDASVREELGANRIQTIAHLVEGDFEIDVYEEA
jgi:hypothetical protein